MNIYKKLKILLYKNTNHIINKNMDKLISIEYTEI